MFGYIKPYHPELKVKESEFYKAVYCGVCASLENCYGRSSSLTLSYDVTFLALLRLALKGEKVKVKAKRCSFNPMKKCRVAYGCEELDFCASLGVILTYYKLLDTVNDERGMKKIAALLTIPVIKRKKRKATEKYGEELCSIISNGISNLSKIEEKRMPSIDTPASVFGRMLGDAASFGLEGPSKKIARSIGNSVGKWIYIADAIDDCEKDIESGSYNPIVALYGRAPSSEEYEMLALTLSGHIEEIRSAIDLVEYREEAFKKNKNELEGSFSAEICAIFQNTLDEGMMREIKRILDSKKCS